MAVYHTPAKTLKSFAAVVPQSFRNTLLSAFPELNNPGHLAVIERAMTYGDLRGKGIALSQTFLAEAYGKLDQLRQRNFVAMPYLEELQSIIPGFSVGEYSYRGGQARYLESRGILTDLWAGMLTEKGEIRGQVSLLTGEAVCESQIEAHRRAGEDFSASFLLSGPQKYVRDYFLANQNPEFVQILLSRLPLAREAALLIDNPHEKRIALHTLDTIEADPRVLLRPSENTWRLFAVSGLGHTNLGSDLRELLFGVDEGLVLPPDEWDLPQAQLRIASALLEIEAISEFLADGGSAWEFFADAYGVPLSTPGFKAACKRGLYSLLYGASLRNVRRFFSEACDYRFDPELFMGSWLIRELALARDEHLAALARPGAAVEVMPGVVVPFGDFRGRAAKARARTLLAFQIQAREQVELMGLFSEVDRRGGVAVNYLFDGLYVRSGK